MYMNCKTHRFVSQLSTRFSFHGSVFRFHWLYSTVVDAVGCWFLFFVFFFCIFFFGYFHRYDVVSQRFCLLSVWSCISVTDHFNWNSYWILEKRGRGSLYIVECTISVWQMVYAVIAVVNCLTVLMYLLTVNKWWRVDTFMVGPIMLQMKHTYVAHFKLKTANNPGRVYIRWNRVRSYAF